MLLNPEHTTRTVVVASCWALPLVSWLHLCLLPSITVYICKALYICNLNQICLTFFLITQTKGLHTKKKKTWRLIISSKLGSTQTHNHTKLSSWTVFFSASFKFYPCKWLCTCFFVFLTETTGDDDSQNHIGDEL